MNPSPPKSTAGRPASANRRLLIWYVVLLLIIATIIGRLFYLQIIRHDHYRQAALSGQLKEYIIPAGRGVIKAREGHDIVPLVLNQKLYTLYADPQNIKNSHQAALKAAAVTKADAGEYEKLMKTKKSRYVILAKQLNEDQHKQIVALKLPGVGTQPQEYRTYPQGTLASQLLGFVNGEGRGTYGIEQALNNQLSGTPGKLKAITDAAGVPLVASGDNIQIDPKNGQDVVLTVDLGMQKQLETLLKRGLDRAKSKSGSALIMDPSTGAVKAIANWPSYDPSRYFDEKDASVFSNAALSSPLEVGSAMKVLTAAAALDQGVVKHDTTYYDPARWELDGYTITNIEEDGGAGTRSVAQILDMSLNTGATWLLMQMGGKTGEVNQEARTRWHDYMVNHYRLGRPTGIEQGYEAEGFIPSPTKGYGLQLTYANTAFGQAMTATPLQMAAALSSVINGGIYNQPRLVDGTLSSSGKFTAKKPVVVRRDVVSPEVSKQMISLMEYVVRNHYETGGFRYLNFPSNYSVGGKTGTAEIANPAGGYFADKFNGTYIGFVGGAKPQYVIAIRVNEPGVGGYAGSQAAQPLFADVAHMLINDFNVIPKDG